MDFLKKKKHLEIHLKSHSDHVLSEFSQCSLNLDYAV